MAIGNRNRRRKARLGSASSLSEVQYLCTISHTKIALLDASPVFAPCSNRHFGLKLEAVLETWLRLYRRTNAKAARVSRFDLGNGNGTEPS
eukprot:3030882-Rhodomonas_salina.2